MNNQVNFIDGQDIFSFFQEYLLDEVKKGYPEIGTDKTSKCVVEAPKDQAHGDFSTNMALILSKTVGQKPQILAQFLEEKLRVLPFVCATNIAGPGFLNWNVEKDYWVAHLKTVLQEGLHYGYRNYGQGEKVNIEYVSANPTGPLHIAHARGAVVGDVLASLLDKAGYDVVKEYYINDAGGQVDKLGLSVYLRYQELFGHNVELAEDGYPGDYVIDIAQKIKDQDGDIWLNKKDISYFKTFAVDSLMQDIRDDLEALGIHHDRFVSERHLVETGKVSEILDILQKKGLIYQGVLEKPKGKVDSDWEERPQTLFRASDFGDTSDRPLQKADGSWTYFTSDIANHYQKFLNGAKQVINVWGADHAGYIKRCDVALKVLTDSQAVFDVKICQLVRLIDKGEIIKMSKRSGKFVTLSDLIDKVGKDVVRFIMMTRRNDQHLDFDLQKVVDQSKDNPIFYVQYAHARCNSVLRAAQEQFPDINLDSRELYKALQEETCFDEEVELLQKLLSWPRIFYQSVQFHEPHRVAFYLYELAGAFHALWNKGKDKTVLRFVHEDKRDFTQARLAIIIAVKNVISAGLNIFSIQPCDKM